MAYEDLQGSPMRVEDHSAYAKKDASQHYAGEVLPIQVDKMRNWNYLKAGPAASSREEMQNKLRNNPATDNVTILPGLENMLKK